MTRIKSFLFSLFIVFITVFFVFFPLTNKIEEVRADDTEQNYSFYGSDLVYLSAYMANSGQGFPIFCISAKTDISVSNGIVSFNPTVYYFNGIYEEGMNSLTVASTTVVPYNTSGINTPYFGFNLSSSYPKGIYGCKPDGLAPGVNSYFPMCAGIEGNFNGNVHGVRLYCSDSMKTYWQYFDNSLLKVKFFYFEYFDNNDNIFYLQFFVPLGFPFTTRTYYFQNALNSNDTYQLGYNEGFTNGLQDNQQDIYNNGYDTGYTVGFNAGEVSGIAQANDYTFLGLLSAVVDAPIKAITGLLNFDFLGINLASFFFSVITILMIVFVVKLFI